MLRCAFERNTEQEETAWRQKDTERGDAGPTVPQSGTRKLPATDGSVVPRDGMEK